MEQVDKLNALLSLLDNVQEHEIHDYYIIELIRDILYEMEMNNFTPNKKLNIESLEKYIDFMNNYVTTLPNGCKNDSNFASLYREQLLDVKNIIIKYNNH